MLITRFLTKFEYIRTLGLFIECFGDDRAYIQDLYGQLDKNNECTGVIKNHRICVVENERGEILCMVQIRPVKAVYLDEAGQTKSTSPGSAGFVGPDHAGNPQSPAAKPFNFNVSYLLCVGTRPDFRRQGLMDWAMQTVFTRLRQKKEPWCFLVPVDREVYRHLGFCYDWIFNKGERDLLDADEGLTLCSAKLLTATSFRPPDLLLSA